jgi:hypothetical protein
MHLKRILTRTLCPASASFSSPCSAAPNTIRRCFFFTNTDRLKREDPYAQLGLQWGDGSTLSDIKAAYRKRAAQLHPDVNPSRQAQEDFQRLQRAYELLTKSHSQKYGSLALSDSSILDMETAWRFGVWRKGDSIATERTDVAGLSKQRPIPPAVASRRNNFAGSQLGHPDGRRGTRRGGEYLGIVERKQSNSVGRGFNKWVQPQEFVPWNKGTSITGVLNLTKQEPSAADYRGDPQTDDKE